jgi:hypothetical protein
LREKGGGGGKIAYSRTLEAQERARAVKVIFDFPASDFLCASREPLKTMNHSRHGGTEKSEESERHLRFSRF